MARRREKKSWSSRKKKLWLVICLIIITSGLYAIFVYLNTRNTGTKFEYTLSDKLWSYLQAYEAKHRAKGNGFGYGLTSLDGVSRTLSARYYNCLLYTSDAADE